MKTSRRRLRIPSIILIGIILSVSFSGLTDANASSIFNPYHLPNNFHPKSGNYASVSLADINYAHLHDGENDDPSLITLPSNYNHLTRAEQFLVITNLERTSRGLTPVKGLNRSLDSAALSGALALADPVLSLVTGSWSSYWSNWAGGSETALAADYGWLYMDGVGSENLDVNHPFGHAYNILNNQYSNVEMGAAYSPKGTSAYQGSATELFASGVNAPMYFTWQQELPYFGQRKLPPTKAGKPYRVKLAGLNGRAPYTFTLLNRSVLGDGLSLSSSGLLSGTPKMGGRGTFQVQIKDAKGIVVATPKLALSVANSDGKASLNQLFGSESSASYYGQVQGLKSATGTVWFRNQKGQTVSSTFNKSGKVLLPFDGSDSTNWIATKMDIVYPGSYVGVTVSTTFPWTSLRTVRHGHTLTVTPVGMYSAKIESSVYPLTPNGSLVFVKNHISATDAVQKPGDILVIPYNAQTGQAMVPIPVNPDGPIWTLWGVDYTVQDTNGVLQYYELGMNRGLMTLSMRGKTLMIKVADGMLLAGS